MHGGTKAWCIASGLTANAMKALVQEEFLWIQTMLAMTAEVVASLSSFLAQRSTIEGK